MVNSLGLYTVGRETGLHHLATAPTRRDASKDTPLRPKGYAGQAETSET